MNNLPIETWTTIFEFACTDGGRTGCALSETCTYFHTAVRPVQLRSVALIGLHKIHLFLAALTQRTPEHRRVQHLFLANAPAGGRPAPPARRESNAALLAQLYAQLAPGLRTLTTVLPDPHGGGAGSVLAHAFPALEELTLPGTLAPPAVLRVPPLPRLRRLHVLSSADTAMPLARAAGALTHVRVSGVWTMSDALFAALERFVRDSNRAGGVRGGGVQTGEDVEDESLPVFDPEIEKIIIVLDGGMLRYGNGHRHFRRGPLARLQQDDKRGKIVVVDTPLKLHLRAHLESQWRQEREDWEDRIIGREGCWSIDKDSKLVGRKKGTTGRAVDI